MSVFVHVPRAEATSTLLCQGFAGCSKAGYSNFGYSAVYQQMWWRMYAGHNCTNYVSYRMVDRGMSATRPWSGSGDARNWGVVFESKVNQTPAIGSIAWWSSNHVAYVQKIVDANTIIISEDHYGGDFDWRRITRSGGGWPTGFIHLNDEIITMSAKPVVTGLAQVGETLTVSTGTWAPAPTAYSYQWMAGGVAIPGATGSSFVVDAPQLGKAISVKVAVARNHYLTNSATTAPTAAVVEGTLDLVGEATVNGIAKVGGTLTAVPNTYAPAATTTTYKWRADGVVIPGATSSTLPLGQDMLGKHVTVNTTARRAGYKVATRGSAPTEEVLPEFLSVTEEPKLTGRARPGLTLTLSPGAVTPEATTSVQWLRGGVPVDGATGSTYLVGTPDLGQQISAQVTYSRPGFDPVVRTLKSPGKTRTIPRISAVSAATRSITVRVRAAGLTMVHANVRISYGANKTSIRPLEKGKFTFSPEWLRSGRRTIKVEVLRSPRVEARTVTIVVQVK